MRYSPKSVVFITGAFISNNCWEEWIRYFELKGYRCVAPPWPHKDAPAEELRNRPADDPIASNTISTLTNHFAALISELPEKPVLIGHALGGLVVQLLLQRELGTAGVAIHSFPPQGLLSYKLSFLKAIWETMELFTSSRKTHLISFLKWKYAIANGMTCEQQKQLYYRYVVAESKGIIRDTFKCLMKIDFSKPHTPLLFTAGGSDRLVPKSLNLNNWKKYAAGNSITDFKVFEGHNHLVFGQPAWKVEADYILHWLNNVNY